MDAVDAQLGGEVDQAAPEPECVASHPVQRAGRADFVVGHKQRPAQHDRQDAVEHLLPDRVVVAGITRVGRIVPRRIGLFAEDGRRLEPLAAGRCVAHQLEAVHVEQVALRQVHHVEGAAAADGFVDDPVHLGRRRQPLGVDPRRFGAVVAKDVVGSEARYVADNDGHLAQELEGRQHLLVVLLIPRENDLHRRRTPGREEGMVDEATLRVLGVGGDLGAGQARSGKTDQTVRADDRFEVGQDLPLDLEVFRRRLDDVIAVGQILHVRRRHHAVTDGRRDPRVELATAQTLPDVPVDPLHARSEGVL